MRSTRKWHASATQKPLDAQDTLGKWTSYGGDLINNVYDIESSFSTMNSIFKNSSANGWNKRYTEMIEKILDDFRKDLAAPQPVWQSLSTYVKYIRAIEKNDRSQLPILSKEQVQEASRTITSTPAHSEQFMNNFTVWQHSNAQIKTEIGDYAQILIASTPPHNLYKDRYYPALSNHLTRVMLHALQRSGLIDFRRVGLDIGIETGKGPQ